MNSILILKVYAILLSLRNSTDQLKLTRLLYTRHYLLIVISSGIIQIIFTPERYPCYTFVQQHQKVLLLVKSINSLTHMNSHRERKIPCGRKKTYKRLLTQYSQVCFIQYSITCLERMQKYGIHCKQMRQTLRSSFSFYKFETGVLGFPIRAAILCFQLHYSPVFSQIK